MAKKRIKPDPEHYFSLCTGALVRDLRELAFALDHISDDEFSHHVNDEKNDFSIWARDIFGELKLADKLEETKKRDDTQMILLKHLVGKR